MSKSINHLVREFLPVSARSPKRPEKSPNECDVTTAETDVYDDIQAALDQKVKEMNLLEGHLLTMLGGMPQGDVERRQGLKKR